MRSGIIATILTPLVLLVCSVYGCSSDNAYPFNHMIGEMYLDPSQVWVSGSLEAEVIVHVYLTGDEGRMPLEGSSVEIFSSRNTGEEASDIIEQPTELTDGNGMAVAYLGSYCTGETHITATADGAVLCRSWEENQCTPLRQDVACIMDCDPGNYACCDSEEGNCGCKCAELCCDPQNCGACNYACEPGEYCVDSVCQE